MEVTMQHQQEYPVAVELPVVWGEMDAFGHVNNIVFFRYFETARIEYFLRLGLTNYMEETGIGPILAETSCRYIQPLQFPDTVTVYARIDSMSGSGFTMEYLLVSKKAGEAARGTGRVVIYDYNNNTKTAIPGTIRKAIVELEGHDFKIK